MESVVELEIYNTNDNEDELEMYNTNDNDNDNDATSLRSIAPEILEYEFPEQAYQKLVEAIKAQNEQHNIHKSYDT